MFILPPHGTKWVTEDDIMENAITLFFLAEPENPITRKRYNQKMI
jgi:hypothetical protein